MCRPGGESPLGLFSYVHFFANAIMRTENSAGEMPKAYEKVVIWCRLVIFDVVLKAFSGKQKRHIVSMSAAIVSIQKP